MDNFLKAQLDKYYQHPQLTTFIAFLDSKEARTIYKDYTSYYHLDSNPDIRFYGNPDVHRNIVQLDATLERLDERGLSLHKVVNFHKFGFKGDNLRFLDENERICYEYRELLVEFLENPARAGQHVLNGARFATAAFFCLSINQQIGMHSYAPTHL